MLFYAILLIKPTRKEKKKTYKNSNSNIKKQREKKSNSKIQKKK